MTTRLYTHTSGPNEAGRTWTIDVLQTWDEVFNKVFPIQAPASNLEHREMCWYDKVDGGRIALTPSNIYAFEEIHDEG